MKKCLAVLLNLVFIICSFSLQAQTKNIQTYSGEKDGGNIKYSYYEDNNGNIILHGKFEFNFKKKIKMGYDEFIFPAYYKGNFVDGKKDGIWEYQVPMYYSNKSSAFGGGTDRIHITTNRNKINEGNYEAEGYIPGDIYVVEQGNRTIKAPFKNGKINGDLTITESVNTKYFEKMAREKDKLKTDKGNIKTIYTITFSDNTLDGHCDMVEDDEVIFQGAFKNGVFDGDWSIMYDTVGVYGKTGVAERLEFSNGILLSGWKMNELPQYTNIDNSNDILKKVIEINQTGNNQEYGFNIDKKSLMKFPFLASQYSNYNEIPLQSFGGLSKTIQYLLYLVNEATSFNIEFYDISNENIIGFNISNLEVTDESKFSKLLGNQFDAIYQKHLKALGGIENVKKIKSYEVSMQLSPSNLNCIIKWKYPDKYFYQIIDSVKKSKEVKKSSYIQYEDYMEDKSTYFWADDGGYLQLIGEPIVALTEDQDNNWRCKCMILPLYQLKLLNFNFIINNNHSDKNEIQILALSQNNDTVRITLDKETYLIKRFAGRNFHSLHYMKDNYKLTNSVMFPLKETSYFPYRQNYQNTASGAKPSYELNKPISTNVFTISEEQKTDAQKNTIIKNQKLLRDVQNGIGKILISVKQIGNALDSAKKYNVSGYSIDNNNATYKEIFSKSIGYTAISKDFINQKYRILYFIDNSNKQIVFVRIEWLDGKHQQESYYLNTKEQIFCSIKMNDASFDIFTFYNDGTFNYMLRRSKDGKSDVLIPCSTLITYPTVKNIINKIKFEIKNK